MASSAEPSFHAEGRGLIVAHGDLGSTISTVLQRYGVPSEFVRDPYAAMGEICANSGAYRVIVLSLQGIYDEELTLIPAIKRRFPHLEIYLAHTDGRQSTLAEAMRLGADGLLSDNALHRTTTPVTVTTYLPTSAPAPTPQITKLELSPSEPLLTAEELRALLNDEPLVSGGEK